MGEDGEAVSPSNFDKPSVEGTSEQQQSAGGELKDAEECEFVPESGAGEGGVGEGGDMHVADGGEGKMEAEVEEEEVGGGGGGTNSDLAGVEEVVVNEEDRVEVSVVVTEEVVELGDRTDFIEDAPGGGLGGGEENDSDVDFVERSHAEKLIIESDNLQSTAAEEDAERVGKPVESSVVMVAAQKEPELAEVKETNVEEMLITEVKVEANVENVTGLWGFESAGDESPYLPKEEANLVGGGKEGIGTEGLENLGSNDLQDISQEPVILADEKLNNPVLESEMEDINVDILESIHKADDADTEKVAEDECAVTDMEVEPKTDVVEESRVLGIGKEAETETAEVGDTESNPTGDGKLVSGDEDDNIVAKGEEPTSIGSEMETKTDEEEQRTLVIEQGEEAEAKIAEVGDVASISEMTEAKLVSLGEEDGEPVAEEGSALDGLEMETRTVAGEEEQGLQILEKDKEDETEPVEVDNVEYIPEIGDVNHVPQDEGDEEMAAEESALADTELETETDVGESGRAVGVKHKRQTNGKGLTKSKTSSKSQKITEEDVCFICFDGGDLFLCDRR